MHPSTDTPVAQLLEGRVRAPGVVFGMPAEAYHADCSLGSSDHKALARSAADYFHGSPLNPARAESEDTQARRWGRALHKLVLEGEVAFAEAYAIKPEPSQFPGCLVGAADLKAYCRENGLKLTGKKADLAAAVKAHKPDVAIWDEVLAAFERRVREAKAEILKRDELVEIQRAAAAIAANPHLRRAFSGGAAEVSVFWRDAETGVPLKARFDYLKPSAILDLKRFANQMGRPFEEACLAEIANRRYDIQAAHYLDAWGALWLAAAEGRVEGHCPLPEGWERFLAAPEAARFVWVFHQATGAPLSRAFEITAASRDLARARREIAAARRLFADGIREFGTSPWVTAEPILPLSDGALPRWLTGNSPAAAPLSIEESI